MAAVILQYMTQVFLRTTNILLGEMPEDCTDTPEVTILVGCEKMNVNNLYALFHIFLFANIRNKCYLE